jgi:hypothetical protein
MTDNKPIKIEQNIRRKVLWPLGIIISISFAGFILVTNYFMALGLDRLQETHFQTLTHNYHNYMLERTGLMRSIMQQLRRDPVIIEALDRRDRSVLLQHSTPLFKELLAEQQITHFYFHTPEGVNLLRVHKPDRHGDQINRVTMHIAQLNNTFADGIELGPLGTFTLRVVMPVYNQARLVGYLELGEDIGPIIDHLAAESDDKIAVLILKRLIDQKRWKEGQQVLNETGNWDLLPEHVVAGIDNPEFIKKIPTITTPEALNRSEKIEVVLAGKTHQGRFLNMMDVGGRSVGSMLILQDVDAMINDHNSSILMITAFSCLLAAFLFWVTSNILGQVDKDLRKVSEHLAEEADRKNKAAITLSLEPESTPGLDGLS